jgi:hypothetical protein
MYFYRFMYYIYVHFYAQMVALLYTFFHILPVFTWIFWENLTF